MSRHTVTNVAQSARVCVTTTVVWDDGVDPYTLKEVLDDAAMGAEDKVYDSIAAP